eukprot:481290_1
MTVLYAEEFNPTAAQIALLLYGIKFWNGIASLLYSALANQYGYDVVHRCDNIHILSHWANVCWIYLVLSLQSYGIRDCLYAVFCCFDPLIGVYLEYTTQIGIATVDHWNDGW